MPYSMNPLTLRLVKGSPLTFDEEDGNFTTIRDFCNTIGQLFNNDGSIDPTLLQSTILNYLNSAFIGASSAYFQPVGSAIWVPKTLAVAQTTTDNGANWLEMDGTKVLQTNFPKLFAFLSQDFRTLDSTTAPDSIGGAVNLATEFRLPNAQNRVMFCRGTNMPNWAAESIIGQDDRDGNGWGMNKLVSNQLGTITMTLQHRNDILGGGAIGAMKGLTINGTNIYAGDEIPTPADPGPKTVGVNNATNTFSMTPPGIVGVGYILAGFKVNGSWI